MTEADDSSRPGDGTADAAADGKTVMWPRLFASAVTP